MAENWENPMDGRPAPLRLAPQCGARSRAGTPCRAPAMANGRCQFHGGKSTGPRTLEGLERVRAARTTHGSYGLDGARLRILVRLLKDGSKKLVEVT